MKTLTPRNNLGQFVSFKTIIEKEKLKHETIINKSDIKIEKSNCKILNIKFAIAGVVAKSFINHLSNNFGGNEERRNEIILMKKQKRLRRLK